jgi:hypothetical protein
MYWLNTTINYNLFASFASKFCHDVSTSSYGPTNDAFGFTTVVSLLIASFVVFGYSYSSMLPNEKLTMLFPTLCICSKQ